MGWPEQFLAFSVKGSHFPWIQRAGHIQQVRHIAPLHKIFAALIWENKQVAAFRSTDESHRRRNYRKMCSYDRLDCSCAKLSSSKDLEWGWAVRTVLLATCRPWHWENGSVKARLFATWNSFNADKFLCWQYYESRIFRKILFSMQAGLSKNETREICLVGSVVLTGLLRVLCSGI
jgi:hypothetical protein